MNKKRINKSLILVALFCLYFGHSKLSYSFSVTYGKSIDHEEFHDGIETSDGGFIACGSTRWSPTDTDVLVVKYNWNSTLEWAFTLNGIPSKTDQCTRIIERRDNQGFIFAGYLYPIDSPCALFAKLSSNGSLVWANRICSMFPPESDEGMDIFEDEDESIVAVAAVRSNTRTMVVKYLSNGTLIWSNRVEVFFGGHIPNNLFPAKDGGYYVGGKGNEDMHASRIFLLKFQSNGSLEWSKAWKFSDMSSFDSCSGVVQVNRSLIHEPGDEESFVYCGYVSTNYYFAAKVTVTGTVDWATRIKSGEKGLSFGCSQSREDGHIIIAGYILRSSRKQKEDMRIAKLDIKTGKVLWVSVSPGSEGNHVANNVRPKQNGGMVVSGSLRNWYGNDKQYAVLATLGDDGEGCLWEIINSSETTQSFFGNDTHDAGSLVPITPTTDRINMNYEFMDSTLEIAPIFFDSNDPLLTSNSICQVKRCNDLFDQGCSSPSQGTCVSSTLNLCQCKDGYYGDKCSEPFCFGIRRNESETVCSGRGKCVSKNICSCEENSYGSKCEYDQAAMFLSTYMDPLAYKNIITSLAVTEDGGYAVYGDSLNMNPLGNRDLFLSKMNPNGSLEWSYAYGESNNDVSTGDSGFAHSDQLIATSDGGFVFCGATDWGSSNIDRILVKVDSLGVVVWGVRMGTEFKDYCQSLQETTDGGFITSGYSYDGPKYGAFVMKLHSNGTIDWSISIYDSTNAFDVKGVSVSENYDGEFYVGAISQVCTEQQVPFLVITKLHKTGEKNWIRIYGGERGYNKMEDLIATSDGGALAVGRTVAFSETIPAPTEEVLVLKINSDGTPIWSSLIHGEDGGHTGGYSAAILPKPNSASEFSYLILGLSAAKNADILNGNVVVYQFSGSGVLEKAREFSFGFFAVPQSIKTTPDGGVAIAGYKTDRSQGWIWKIFDGIDLGCDEKTRVKDVTSKTSVQSLLGLNRMECPSLEWKSQTENINATNFSVQQSLLSSETVHLDGLCMERYECFGDFNPETACSGHGKCSGYDTCTCDSSTFYFGEKCQIHSCFGVFNNDTTKVCASHGECIDRNKCSCHNNYFEANCDVFKCFGKWRNDSLVCNGLHGTGSSRSRGNCTAHDECSCEVNHDTSDGCDWSCFGVANALPKTCGGHGICMEYDECNCTSSQNYTGPECDTPTCGGIVGGSRMVCSGHGKCDSLNVCDCEMGYQSKTDDKSYCDWFQCHGVTNDEFGVCSSHGTCDNWNDCNCLDDYEGDNCETFSCGSIDKDDTENTCSGSGSCKSPNVCDCDIGFTGDLCETNTLYYSVMAPVLSVSVIFAGMIFCFLLICCGVCCVGVFLGGCICVFGVCFVGILSVCLLIVVFLLLLLLLLIWVAGLVVKFRFHSRSTSSFFLP